MALSTHSALGDDRSGRPHRLSGDAVSRGVQGCVACVSVPSLLGHQSWCSCRKHEVEQVRQSLSIPGGPKRGTLRNWKAVDLWEGRTQESDLAEIRMDPWIHSSAGRCRSYPTQDLTPGPVLARGGQRETRLTMTTKAWKTELAVKP